MALKLPDSLRISLRAFLVLCLVCGAAIGLFVRWRLYVSRYDLRSTTVEGFAVRSMWIKQEGHKELVYLIAYPDGNLYGGGATTNPNSAPSSHGVHLHPSGLYVNGNRRDGRYFVYTNASGQGNARMIETDLNMTPQDFERLDQTALWKEHLRPALIEESQRFDQWYLETHGSPNAFSRFPLKMKTGSFVAKDANGNPVTVHIYTKYIRSKSQANLIIPGGQGLTTDDGYNVNFNVNRLEKGKYEIEPTGQVLTSDDPNAP